MTAKMIGRHMLAGAVSAARASKPVLAWTLRRAAGGAIPDVPVPPVGRLVDLPDRGTTHVLDLPGPGPDAPTVLLMHGIATTGSLTWFTVLEELAQRYRVVTFDQRWHGRGIRSERFTLDDCADDAAAVLDALGVDRAVVVGYSMGGATAQVLWQRHPDRIAGLVLCSTAARWQGHLGERVFYLTLRVATTGLLPRLSDRIRLHAQGLPAMDATTVHDAELRAWCLAELRSTSLWALPVVLGELGHFDASAWIGRATVPVGVLITAKDRAIPTVRQRDLAALFPDAVVRESPGGHASLAFDLPRWRPVFLETVAAVVDRALPMEPSVSALP